MAGCLLLVAAQHAPLSSGGLSWIGRPSRSSRFSLMADDCIFCKVVAGELPSYIVQEDQHTMAFMDINPWTRGHALVIPRSHSANLYEVPEEDLARTASAAKRLALTMRDRLACDGVNLLNCCEPAAWQTVFHMHIHVIPRYDDDPLQLPIPPQPADQAELEKVAQDLRGG
jgi:histidine triad (HIT) family protein